MLLLYASGYTNYLSTLLRTVQFAFQLSAHPFTITTAILSNNNNIIIMIDTVLKSQITYSYSFRDIMYKSEQRDSYPHVLVESLWPPGKFLNSGPSLTQATGHHIFRPNTDNHPTSLCFPNNVTQIFYWTNLNVKSFLYSVHFHLSKNYCNGELKQEPKSII
jgi:hypothetical protein